MRNLLIAAAIALILTGCGNLSSRLQGEWSNQEAKNVNLTITPDTIQVESGNTVWKFNYKVISSDEKQKKMTAELDDGAGRKENITIVILEGGSLHITWHTSGVNGHWKKIR